MSHWAMHTSVLAREELRIFEELISQFDSLSKAEMRAVGVTREWPAKDNQHASLHGSVPAPAKKRAPA